MSNAFPLQTLLDLSQLRLDEAARRLGQLIASEQEATKRHELLVEYRGEYQARFVAAVQAGLSPREWQNFQGFLQKLDEAVNQAEVMASQSRQKTSLGQREWLSKRGNVKAYDTLAERHRSRLQWQETRREQKSQDEFAARGTNDPEHDPI